MVTITKGEQTKRQILEAAYDLFSNQGFHGTSMRQISDKAKITLGGIYNHFNSKDEIFEGVLIQFHPISVIPPLIENVEGETVEDYIHRVGNLIYSSILSKKEFLNIFFIEFVEFNGKHIPKLFSQIFPKGLELIKNTSNKKGSTKNIPPESILVSFAGLVFASMAFHNLVDDQKSYGYKPLDFDSLLDIILYGIIDEKGSEIAE